MASADSARIDRLLIDVPGGSADQARELALLVAEGLNSAGALPQVGDVPTLRVAVEANEDADPTTLAHRIVAATLRGLALAP